MKRAIAILGAVAGLAVGVMLPHNTAPVPAGAGTVTRYEDGSWVAVGCEPGAYCDLPMYGGPGFAGWVAQ